MKEHELKCWSDPFNALDRGEKPFEWRKDDRGYEVGDILWLREWRPNLLKSLPGEYTGRELKRLVTYIVRGPRFDIPEGYCIMGVRPLTIPDKLTNLQRTAELLEQLKEAAEKYNVIFCFKQRKLEGVGTGMAHEVTALNELQLIEIVCNEKK